MNNKYYLQAIKKLGSVFLACVLALLAFLPINMQVNAQSGSEISSASQADAAAMRELAAGLKPSETSAHLAESLSGSEWKNLQQQITADLSQTAYLKASNPDTFDRFGTSVAISGNTLVVGARGERSSATGVDGDQADNSFFGVGAVYVFVREGQAWTQQAYLKASNADGSDLFGTSVAISGDTIVVGAPQEDSSATGIDGNQADNSAQYAGAAYVFTRTGTNWSQQAYLKASNTDAFDYFGFSVGISGDTIVVGALYEASSATGVNGEQNDNNALSAGAAYVFTRTGAAWAQQAYLKASNTDANDFFGGSVAISGETIVIAAGWESSSAAGVDGNQADNSLSSSGAAYVFERESNTWYQQAYLKASNPGENDSFGTSVAISGDTIVIGAHYEDSSATGVNGQQANDSAEYSGAAYVFVREYEAWAQQAYLKASNTDAFDYFGFSVGISGDTIVVGAWTEGSSATEVNGDESDNTAESAGAAYVFVRSIDTWSQAAYLKASNTEAGDNFGTSVAVSEGTIIIAAPNESSNAVGVDGNQADNSMSASGAVYVLADKPAASFGIYLPLITR